MLRSLFTVALMAALALPASADATLAFLPAAPTARVHYRVVRTQQTARNPAISVTSFDLVRRTAETLVLERANADGSANDTMLTQGADGSLTLAGDGRGAAGDADLADPLYAVNLAIAATRGSDATARTPWTTAIPLAPGTGAASVMVTIEPGPGTPGSPDDFDFAGSGERPAPGGGGAMQASIRIDGHATAGYLTRIAITQTRSVTVGGLPFVNAGSWAINVGP
jgi:hypothetical protein